MRTVIVRYQTKPDRADENQQLAEFQREIADRCAVQPVAQGATLVGSHRFVPD
jgi:hypothetical protein